MNDYYLSIWTYAPVHNMHNFYLYETELQACFATVDDFGDMIPHTPVRWYALNT